MCSGAKKRAKVRAENERKRQEAENAKKAAEAQAILDQQAADRADAIAANQEAMNTAQAQHDKWAAEQAAKAEQLKAQHEIRLGETKARGRAVSSSLRILGQERLAKKSAPTATQSTRSRKRTGARTTTASLRLGQGQSGSGSGTNYST